MILPFDFYIDKVVLGPSNRNGFNNKEIIMPVGKKCNVQR